MIINPVPKVSCLMATRNRPHFVRRAVSCWLSQTYPNKELVVLCQSDPNEKAENKKILDGVPGVKVFDAPQRLILGAMRNTLTELASGDLAVQWDDDDVSHPDRLKSQVRAMKRSPWTVGCAYSRFLKLFSGSGEVYYTDWSKEVHAQGCYLATTLMYRREVALRQQFFYPELDRAEDQGALRALMSMGHVAKVMNGHEYVYVHHGTNVYDFDHHMLSVDTRWGKKLMPKDDFLLERPLVEQILSQVGSPDPITARSPDGVSFVYQPGVSHEV